MTTPRVSSPDVSSSPKAALGKPKRRRLEAHYGGDAVCGRRLTANTEGAKTAGRSRCWQTCAMEMVPTACHQGPLEPKRPSRSRVPSEM